MAAKKHYLAALAASLGVAAAPAASAQAAVFLCVPTTAGAAVTSGGADGASCGTSKPVELPESRADQKTLLSILPYLSFNPTGVGGKPTVQVKGANLQILNGAGTTSAANGAGNLILGYNENAGTQTGSHSFVSGRGNSFSSFGQLVNGTNNKATGAWASVLGYNNSVSGAYSTVVGGYSNQVSGFASTIVAGHDNTAQGSTNAIVGGNKNLTGGDSGTIVSGFNNVASGAESAILGGNGNSAFGRWSTIAGGKSGKTTLANQTHDGTHYWVRVNADGTKAAESGTVRGTAIDTYHYTGGWTLAWFHGIDVSKCSVNAEPDTGDGEVDYRYQTSEYVYVRVARAGVPSDSAGVSITIDCNNPAP